MIFTIPYEIVLVSIMVTYIYTIVPPLFSELNKKTSPCMPSNLWRFVLFPTFRLYHVLWENDECVRVKFNLFLSSDFLLSSTISILKHQTYTVAQILCQPSLLIGQKGDTSDRKVSVVDRFYVACYHPVYKKAAQVYDSYNYSIYCFMPVLGVGIIP